MRAVVVGGGLAGAAAALDLAEAGARVTLVERRPEPGGRAYSYRDGPSGEVVDNGQHVLFGCYRETLDLLGRLGTAGGLLPARRIHVPYRGDGPPAELKAWPLPPPLDLAGGLLALGGLSLGDKLGVARAVRAAGRLDARELAELDRATVAEWLGRLGQTARVVRRFWEPMAVSAINETLDRASARWLAVVVREVFLGPPGSAAVLLPRVGLSQLWAEALAPALAARGGRILLGRAVRELRLDGSGRATGVALAGGEELAADAVVLALAPWELAAVLPEALRGEPPFAHAGQFAPSPIVSVHLWLDREPTPQPFAALLGTRMQFLFNPSRMRGLAPGHVTLVASAAHALQDLPLAAIEQLAVDEVRQLFAPARAAVVRRVVVINQRRATPSLRPGLAGFRTGAATPVANLALAGDWTDPDLPATIESAVRSGRRAARRLLEGRGREPSGRGVP